MPAAVWRTEEERARREPFRGDPAGHDDGRRAAPDLQPTALSSCTTGGPSRASLPGTTASRRSRRCVVFQIPFVAATGKVGVRAGATRPAGLRGRMDVRQGRRRPQATSRQPFRPRPSLRGRGPVSGPRGPTESAMAVFPTDGSSPAGLLGQAGLRPCCSPTTWRSARAPATSPPSCAPSAPSRGRPPCSTASRRPRTAATARTRTGAAALLPSTRSCSSPRRTTSSSCALARWRRSAST